MPAELTNPTPAQHYGLYGGANPSSEAHLLGEREWLRQHNIRLQPALTQIEKKRSLWSALSGNGAVDAIINLPNGRKDFGLWVMLTKNVAHTFGVSGPITNLGPLNTELGHFSVDVHNGRAFFTNPRNPVHFVDAVHSTIQPLYARRGCWTKPNGEDLLGGGGYTKHPLYDGETPVGDLSNVFEWTEDVVYRVYVERPKLFPAYCVISIRVVRTDKVVLTLPGLVIGTGDGYLLVKATGTASGVPNDSDDTAGVFYPDWVQVLSMQIPSGRYVKIFFDHVVVGAAVYKGVFRPNTTMWSHLYDYANWVPGTDSEADSYTFTEYQRSDDIVTGVSGLAHMGEEMLVFTPSCVSRMVYTGLPRVVRVVPYLKDVGNSLPYALAELNSAAMWCDVHHGQFFMLRGGELTNVGSAVSDYFFADVSTDKTWLGLTWCYVDRSNSEVTWVYRSSSEVSGQFDKAIVYDYAREVWYTRSVENVRSHGQLSRRALTIDELTGTVDNLSGYIDDLEEGSGDELAKVWGRETGIIMRDEVAADDAGDLLAQETPVLETGDLIYGSAQVMKTVSEITLNANASVQVEVSVREHFDDAVSWTVVGTWTLSLSQKKLTFAPKAGKVLRYRFTPVTPVRGFVFRGYEDNISSTGAHR